MNPLSVRRRDDALGAQNRTVTVHILERFKVFFNLLHREFLRSLDAPAREDLVGMVMMLVIVVMTAAAALIVMVVMVVMFVFMVMIVMMFVFVFVVMIVMMFMLVVMIMMMLMLMLVIVMVFMLVLFHQFLKLGGQRVLALDRFGDLLALKLFPRRRDDDRFVVMLTQQFDAGFQLFL